MPAAGDCGSRVSRQADSLKTMNGTDWAYTTLVDIALAHSKEHVKECAKQFRLEVLNACVGMACADIDWKRNITVTRYACETVRDVCMELTAKQNESSQTGR
jgi:hypothetical protein